MRVRDLLLACLMLGLPVAGFAATSPPGVNLRWDACYRDGGVSNKNFACNTNLGTELLVGSFELVQPLNDVLSAQIVLDLRSASPTLPTWWSLAFSGGCRSRSMDFRPTGFPQPGVCSYDGLGAGGGLGAYSIGLQGPSHVRLTGAFAVPTLMPVNLLGGVEYYAFFITIDHAKTVGSGACGGCEIPVCLFLSRISLFQRGASTAAIHLEQGANHLGSQYVTWQNGYPTDVHQVCDAPASTCDTH